MLNNLQTFLSTKIAQSMTCLTRWNNAYVLFSITVFNQSENQLVLLHRGYYVAARRYEIFHIFKHSKRHFVSSSGHVMFYLSYKYR